MERLLDGCANLRVLCTSLEPLPIAGEETWTVPSLAVPDARTEPSRLAAYPAVELFAERARTVRPDFTLADGSARTMAAICRRLEGIPLAIEPCAILSSCSICKSTPASRKNGLSRTSSSPAPTPDPSA